MGTHLGTKLQRLYPNLVPQVDYILAFDGVDTWSFAAWNAGGQAPNLAAVDAAITDLDIVKDQRWEYIKRRRQQELDGGVAWGAHRWDTQEDDINRIARALTSWQRALMLPPEAQALLPGPIPQTISWTTEANDEVLLSFAELSALDAAISLHVGSVFEIAKALREQISAAASEAAVNAIDWPA